MMPGVIIGSAEMSTEYIVYGVYEDSPLYSVDRNHTDYAGIWLGTQGGERRYTHSTRLPL